MTDLSRRAMLTATGVGFGLLAEPDRLVAMKAEYERTGTGRSNLRYGYIVPGLTGQAL